MDQTATFTIQQQSPSQVSVSVQEAVIPPAQQNLHKRKQVKNACTNCQKACKKCDDARPCVRCVKCGLTDTCVDSVRKERKKGLRRGPYKRKGRQGVEEDRTTSQSSDAIQASTAATSVQPLVAYAPPIPGPNSAPDYGYPANLNQYNFGTYNPAFYGSDKVPTTGPYMIYPYHPETPDLHKGTQLAYPYPPQMMMLPFTFAQPQETPREDEGKDDMAQQNSEPACSRLDDNNKDETAKHQPMTPVPSTSSSSLTSSSPDSNEEDNSSKFARITQLCSAAMKGGGTNTANSE